MSKKTISFKEKKRAHHERSSSKPRPPQKPTEWDDLRAYWHNIFKHPLTFGERTFWTDRMLWSNAIVAGILRAIASVMYGGFNPLLLFTALINTLFVAFLLLYGFSWIVRWILGKFSKHKAMVNQNGIHTQIIIQSGWLIIFSLFTFVPYPWTIDIVFFAFFLMLWRGIHHVSNLGWFKTLVATLGGYVTFAVILIVFMKF